MRRIVMYLFMLASVLLCLPGLSVRAFQEAPTATIDTTLTAYPSAPEVMSPRPGQALQGNVPIVVFTALQELKTVELSFGYFQDPTQTWFPLFHGDQALEYQPLLEWNMGQISDGDYTLRLVVTLNDGSQQTVLVPGLRVRNYTPVETDTPAPNPPTATPPPQDTPAATSTVAPTPTSLPPTPTALQANPAALTSQDIYASAGKGILAVLSLFALGLLYNSIRSRFRRN